MVFNWFCDNNKCGWKGDQPDSIPSHEYLKMPEEECEPEFVEVCPKCNSLALETVR